MADSAQEIAAYDRALKQLTRTRNAPIASVSFKDRRAFRFYLKTTSSALAISLFNGWVAPISEDYLLYR